MAPITRLPKSWSARDPKSEADLWNLFEQKSKQGNPTSLAHLSTIHFQTHHRPLRIALDQDSWNYGLTRQQERQIQKSQRKAFKKQTQKSQSQIWFTQKYTPVPKRPRLFHREINVLTRLMGYIALGVEFYVILPSPLDREDVGDLGDRYKHANGKIHMWFRILGDLGVRFHAAANPVVECVHMMEEGVVDAVWTNNPDVLVYCGGKAVVIRDFEESEEEVRVYRIEELRREVSWTETVFIHTLVRSGCRIADIQGTINTNNLLHDTLPQIAINLCNCSSQKEVNDWFQRDISPYITDSNIPRKSNHNILENYLNYSVSNRNLFGTSKEAQLFRERSHGRMQEIKETHADALDFYNSNLADRVRRLWEYSRDTFSIKAIEFLNLMGSVLLARKLSGGNFNPTLVSSVEEGVAGVDHRVARVAIKIEREPILWNLRLKMAEDLAGLVLNLVVLKTLLWEVGNCNAEGTPSKEDTSHHNVKSKRKKRARARNKKTT
ncbi:hypothetical protein EYR41_003414 [Orbilia oligospora]|uniref:Uncharacterized protein n=1 Tax=Orbilia oligospora TaxID=2813651 RepID=A0A7C8PL59_ORBOL|nr:hypothetical protein TWF751_010475 [Orbilia oligospora]TGJ71450.1 hypothetical protein EYR41_003414 [Orbilia oligospora]